MIVKVEWLVLYQMRMKRMQVGFKNPQMRLNGNGGETDYKLCIMLKDII